MATLPPVSTQGTQELGMHPLKPRLQNLSAQSWECQCHCGKTKALLPPGSTHTPHTQASTLSINALPH